MTLYELGKDLKNKSQHTVTKTNKQNTKKPKKESRDFQGKIFALQKNSSRK